MATHRSHNRPRRLARLALALGVTLGSLALMPARPLSAASSSHFSFFPVTCIGFPNLCATQGIVTGSDNNLWFTEPNSVVGRITLSGTVTQRFLPSAIGTADASWIAAGPDGNLWVTLDDVIHGQSALARITPHFGMTVFPLPSQHGLATEAQGITVGPDHNLWIADPLGRIYRATVTGTVTTFNTGVNTSPTMITSGPDGNLWFTDTANERIGRITPGGQITYFAVLAPTLLRPVAITAGPDGNLWFVSEGRGNMIGRITTAGVVTLFPLPNPSSDLINPGGITTGPDGALWFTASTNGGSFLGRSTTAGKVSEIVPASPPSCFCPQGITAGPDKALWMADSGFRMGNIARFALP